MEKLSDLHRLLARTVALENATNTKLREITGYTPQSISRIVNDPLFVAEVKRLSDDLEEHQITQKKKALAYAFENLENLVTEQVRLGLHAENESVRSAANDRVTALMLRKKDSERGDEAGSTNVMVQLRSDVTKALEDDPDVSPSANPKVLDFIEKKQANDA